MHIYAIVNEDFGSQVSEAIMAEEDDEINAERNILEIDEQL